MLFLTYLLIGGTLYYFIAHAPNILPEELLFKRNTPLKVKFGAVVGIAAVIIICSIFLKPEYGYDESNLLMPFRLLFLTTILLLWSLIEVQAKVKTYYARTYNAVMTETKDAQGMLAAANTRSLQLTTKEEQLLLLDSEVRHKTAAIEEQSNLLEELKSQLNMREEQIIKQEKTIEQSIGQAVQDKEGEIRSIYEQKFRSESDRLQQGYHEKMVAFVNNATAKMEKRISSEKKQVLEDVFQFDEASSDDMFELKRAKEALEKEREEMQKSQFLLDIDKKVAQASDHVLDAKRSALEVKSENVELRTDIKLMASDFKTDLNQEKVQREKSTDTLLHQLELEQERRKSDFRSITDKLLVMDAQTKARFIEMHGLFSSALKDMEVKMSNSFREIRENMSDIKLQFGQEVLRLDGQQGQILNELEKYYVKNQQFVNQCQSLALDAQRQNLEGQKLHNEVNHLYSQHKVESWDIENRMRTTLDKVALSEGKLANSVGESMLKLKSLSDEQYIAMKDLALEKKDVGLLWKEKNMEHHINLQEVRHQKSDLDRTRQLFNQEKSAFNQHKTDVVENARLTHRSFMKEQEHLMAMQKAQNSGGFLTRWARNFEALRNSN